MPPTPYERTYKQYLKDNHIDSDKVNVRENGELRLLYHLLVGKYVQEALDLQQSDIERRLEREVRE